MPDFHIIAAADGGGMASFASLPQFMGKWNDKPVTIKLDSSAVMKLSGNGSRADLVRALQTPPRSVADAARRLIETRQTEAAGDSLVVVISALDLD